MSHRNLFVAAASGLVVAVLVAVAPVRGAGWNPQLAAKYLDDRQRDWFAWPQAQSKDGPCVSCHTGMPYLLARPALRRLLHESQPTMYETGLLNRLRANAGAKPAGALQSVETIFAAMLLPEGDAAQAATFDQLWALQKKDGALKGGWQWYSANLDPWETPQQFFYGSALATFAIGSAPPSIRDSSVARAAILEATDYLTTDVHSLQGHVSLAKLWASTKVSSLLTPVARQATIDKILQNQRPDGGWTLESLGPWTKHPDAPVSPAAGASDSYATAFTAFVLKQGLGARVSGLAAVIDQSGARLAEGASGPADRRMARGVDEQEISRRIDAGKVPAGRGHGIRSGRLIEPVDDVDRRDSGNSICCRIRKLITGSERLLSCLHQQHAGRGTGCVAAARLQSVPPKNKEEVVNDSASNLGCCCRDAHRRLQQ